MNTFFDALNPATTAIPAWYAILIGMAAVSCAGTLFFVIRDFVRGLKNPA